MADDLNPYASPTAPNIVTDMDPRPDELRIASQGTRFLNLILDYVATYILSAGVGFVFGLVFAITQRPTNANQLLADESTVNIIGAVLGLIVTLAYYIFMEMLCQRTFAKFLTGTRVVAADGGRPSFGQIVGRSFARLIPFEAFSFLGNKNPVGWHDSLSGTRVVSTR